MGYLIAKGLNAVIKGNDILIDGKKVAGGGSFAYNGVNVASLFLAVQDSSELVKNICGESKKKPTGLEKYNVSAEDISNAVFSYLQSN